MNINNQLDKYKGFKLLSLELIGNSLMGKSNLIYDFIDEIDKKNIFYTTVIIGANGTGKSNLFRIIIELFKELYDLKSGKKRSYKVDGFFNLKYSLNGDIYEYTNFIDDNKIDKEINLKNINSINYSKKNAFLIINNEYKKDFVEVNFPLSIIANSIMITDKFPFYRTELDFNSKIESFPIYKYLGVRNTPQSTSTRAYVRKTVEFIVNQFKNEESQIIGFISVLKRATEFLELENSIEILYNTSNNPIFFQGDLTIEKISFYFENIHKKYINSIDKAPFKIKYFLKIKKNKNILESICIFCNQLVIENKLKKIPKRNTTIRQFSYNLSDENQIKSLINDYQILEYLRLLGMINPPEIQLKRGNEFSLQESSSGEYQFFSSIVGLMATVNPTNSLVFIDEPEISLHPNWQMKYFAFLRELFSYEEYSTCHIFVATHSHFLISDLKGDSSKIIGLKREDNEIKIINLPKNIDTFGWSAEEVLYTVFNVRTVRNYFLEHDLTKLLGLIGQNSKDYNEIKILIERIDQLPITDKDPLREIIIEAKNYLNNYD